MKRFQTRTALLAIVAIASATAAFAANEVGTYPTAGPLNGSERMLADQSGVTVDILPSQITSYFQTSGAIFSLLPSPLVNGYCLANNGSALVWQACSATGTVTSIGLTMPSGFTVTGSPITSNGTLAVTTTLSGLLKGSGSGFTTAGVGDLIGLFSGCVGTDYLGADGACHSIAAGSVTSVGLSAPSWLTVSGSPVTSSGTLSIAGATGQTTHEVLGTSTTGTVNLVALSAADLPSSITSSTSGNAATATALATAPSQCGAGSFASGIATSGNANCSSAVTSVGLSAPSIFSVGGSPVTGSGTLALSFASGQAQNQFLATPSGLSGALGLRGIVSADLPSTITSNTSGNAATATALAAVPTQCPGGQFATGVAASGNANCTTPAGGGNVSTSGTPAANQAAVFTSGTGITGVAMGQGQILVGQSAGAPIATSSPILGASGTLGSISFGNATSGTVTLEPVAGALGAAIATLPANTGTVAETNLAQSFSALQTFGTNISIGGVTAAGATGTGNVVFGTGPTLTTPNIGAATGTSLALSTPLSSGSGGTGNSSAPPNGALLIGNGSGYSLATLTAGSGISISNAAGSISISAPNTGVSSFSGDGALLSNSLSTGAVTAALANTGVGYGVWGNTGAVSGAPGYHALSAYPTAAFPTLNQSTTGNAATATALSTTGANGTFWGVSGGVQGYYTPTAAASSITPGTTTVVGSTAPCLIANTSGTTMGCPTLQGLAINAGVIGPTFPSRTVTVSPTVASTDMGGVIFSNVTGGGTVTIPAISSTVLASGMSVDVVNYSASTAAVTSTPTVNAGGGCVTATGIPAGDRWELVSNGTSLDCVQTTPTSSGGGSGTVNSGAAGQLGYYAATGTAVSGTANASISAGALTLGASGTVGSVTMGNATSGTVTLQTATGALGSSIATLPSGSGTLAETGLAQGWGATQGFNGGITSSDVPGASASVMRLTGAMFTGGTGATTFPYVYLNQGGTAPTTFSTAGTEYGVNAPSGFTGRMADWYINGTEVAKLSTYGNLISLPNTATSATSVTPNCEYAFVKVTASATGTFTVNAPTTCTPTDGQKLELKIISPAGGTITYAWNATYLVSATLALPTTSNAASKEDYFSFQYDADKSGWVFLASNQGF